MIPAFPHELLTTWNNNNNNMLICTLATNEKFINMLNIASPTIWAYADIHKIDTLLLPMNNLRLHPARPDAWDKIILINHMLNYYEIVMWIDSDCIFFNPWPDIRTTLHNNHPIYLVRQQWGGIVNSGVFVARSNQESREILNAIWNNTNYIHHPWWEQAALLDLMGYQLSNSQDPNNIPFYPTPLSHRIGHLDTIWNSCCSALTEQTVIKHYCGPKNFDQVYQDMKKDAHDFFWKLDNCR